MKNLEYNLHKIAANNKLLIEVLESKMTLDKVQHNNFTMLFNITQELMRQTSYDFLILKGNEKAAQKLKTKLSYVREVTKIVENSLFELRKNTAAKFDKKYIQFINTDNF